MKPHKLDPITEADVDAALARMETQQEAPREKYVGSLLQREQWNEHREPQRRIKANTPKQCRCCGEPFRSTKGFTNCGTCRAAGKKRCIHCNEVFAPEHNKIKQCESCLAKELAWKATRRAPRSR